MNYAAYRPRPLHGVYAARLLAGAAFSSMMPFVLLHFTETFKLSPVSAGSVLSVQELMPVFTGMVAGWLVVRTGSRSLLGAALGLLGLTTWQWMNGAGGLEALWASAVVSGISFSALRVAFSSTVADLVEKEEASHAFAMLHAYTNVGMAVGPLLNSYWVSQKDYRNAFWVPIGLYLLAALVISLGISSDVGRSGEGPDGSFDLRRLRLEYGGWGLLFISAIMLTMFFNGIRAQANIIGLAKYFTDYFHSTRATSMYWTVQSLAVVLLVPFGGRLVRNWDIKALFIAFVSGMALIASGFWTLGFFGPSSLSLAFASLIVLTVLGECLCVPCYGALLVNFLGKKRTGMAFGMASTIGALGMSVGASLAGVLLERSERIQSLPSYWQWIGPLCVGAFVVAFALGYIALHGYQKNRVAQEA